MAAESMIATLQQQHQQRVSLSDGASVAVRLASTFMYLSISPGKLGESLIAWQTKISHLNPTLAVAFSEKVRDYRAIRRTSLRWS